MADDVVQPVSIEANSYIADHVMVILTGFAEQSRASVLHMSSLFHAFILCQLWTMYCEVVAVVTQSPESQRTITEFWCRVTPGVLQLLSHSAAQPQEEKPDMAHAMPSNVKVRVEVAA